MALIRSNAASPCLQGCPLPSFLCRPFACYNNLLDHGQLCCNRNTIAAFHSWLHPCRLHLCHLCHLYRCSPYQRPWWSCPSCLWNPSLASAKRTLLRCVPRLHTCSNERHLYPQHGGCTSQSRCCRGQRGQALFCVHPQPCRNLSCPDPSKLTSPRQQW